jgi:hypothetical protein
MPLTRIQSLGITDGTIVNADINASAAIVGTKLTGVNDAKAWVNFDGTGTVAIRGSFNISSITDGGTGLYTINYTTAMPDVNYSVVASGRTSSIFVAASATISTSSVLINAVDNNNTANDPTHMFVAVFR